ncbi:hypothetical protein SDC9_59460 [bioreactor metagenome]|uniref:Uncharacterized protein n=1 Tax=bioreactor metagenome TaxID=1076179 RepID=A0A644XA78_9ZZZZ
MVGVVRSLFGVARSEEVVGSGDLLLEVAEVLGAHDEGRFLHVVRPEHSVEDILRHRRDLRLVDGGGNEPLVVEGEVAPADLACPGDDPPESGFHVVLDGGVEGAHRAVHLHRIGDDVEDGEPRLDSPGADHHRLLGAHFPSDDGLEVEHDVCRRDGGVDAEFGRGAVAALALQGEVPAVGRRHDGARAVEDRPGGGGGPAVDARHGVNSFEGSFLHHGFGAGFQAALLGGLEQEAHRARYVIPDFRQHFRRPEEHGRVGIVAAGVHDAVLLRPVGKVVVLVHGKGVHVAPEGHPLSRLSAPEVGHHAAFGAAEADLHDVASDFFQFFDYRLRCFHFLPGDFGVCMKMMPERRSVALG